jgi:hypothetical protein
VQFRLMLDGQGGQVSIGREVAPFACTLDSLL